MAEHKRMPNEDNAYYEFVRFRWRCSCGNYGAWGNYPDYALDKLFTDHVKRKEKEEK